MSGLLPETVAAEAEKLVQERAGEPANERPQDAGRLEMRSGK